MTRINLNFGYFIEIDTYNYTLKQEYKGQTKDGQEKDSVRTCGHFGKIDNAIAKYLKLVQIDVLDGESISMSEYVKSIEIINKMAIQGLESVLSKFEVK